MIIDCKKITDRIIAELRERPVPKKFFAVVLVGNNSASEKFVAQKEKLAQNLCVDFRIFRFPDLIDESGLIHEVSRISSHGDCGGIIVQLPLPSHIDRVTVLSAIFREKDLDVLSPQGIAAYRNGSGLISPAVLTFTEVLSSYQSLQNVSCETFAIVGNGFLIGEPIAYYLKAKNQNISVYDKGSDFCELKNADVVILGAGSPHLITGDMIKEKGLVVDFGCSFVDGKLCGDFNPINSENVFYTPTPSGTGPILVAKLFENFYKVS